MVSEGADAPLGFPFTISYQKGVQEGRSPSLKSLPPLLVKVHNYHQVW
jgi:hypothetical protein